MTVETAHSKIKLDIAPLKIFIVTKATIDSGRYESSKLEDPQVKDQSLDRQNGLRFIIRSSEITSQVKTGDMFRNGQLPKFQDDHRMSWVGMLLRTERRRRWTVNKIAGISQKPLLRR